MEDKQAIEKQQQQQEQKGLSKITNQDIEKVVYRLEMVMAYPLTEVQIENWAEHIFRLCPSVTMEQISEIVDKYLTGEWTFDKDQGIANIIWPLQNPTGAVWNP